MSQSATNPLPADPFEEEVREALAICGGDALAALRASLIINSFLEAEIERLSAALSSGFVRGRLRQNPERGEPA